jgi:hypothetical protein
MINAAVDMAAARQRMEQDLARTPTGPSAGVGTFVAPLPLSRLVESLLVRLAFRLQGRGPLSGPGVTPSG